MTIRVLIIDDSAVARQVLTRALESDSELEVIGVAASSEVAWTRVQRLKPDVITLDLRLGTEDGVALLQRIMAEHPVPTVVVSAVGQRGSRECVAALSAGAVFVVAKPSSDENAVSTMAAELRTKVKQAATATLRRPLTRLEPPRTARPPITASPAPTNQSPTGAAPELIAIGTSTGGAAALARILPMFPADSPPIVIVDHMPAGYTRAMAERLDGTCRLRVYEATDGKPLDRGIALIAPGDDRHLHVRRHGRQLIAVLVDGPPTDGHRPSVTELFTSVTQAVGSGAAGALLTGMGRDGAVGLQRLRNVGAFTVAQDEVSSVVYGMPRAAMDLGAAMEQLPLDEIPARLLLGHRRRN